MTDLVQGFKSLPLFTRHWLGLTVFFSLLGRFGFLDFHHFILDYDPIVQKFQIWRPFTALFFYPLMPSTGFHFLINCYFLYSYSLRLETGQFDNYPADYFFLLTFNWICCVVIGFIAKLPVLMDPMVLSVLYIWCQLNKDVIVNFWFGSRFKAMYLPWVLLMFNMIISGGGVMELIGILVGHLYFFLMFKYPQEMGGPRLLSTPGIFQRWFPAKRTYASTFGPVPRADLRGMSGGAGPPAAQRRHNWGQGHVLGAD